MARTPQPDSELDPNYVKAREYRRKHGSRQTSVLLNPADFASLDIIQERMKLRQADAIRTALRVYAAILLQQK